MQTRPPCARRRAVALAARILAVALGAYGLRVSGVFGIALFVAASLAGGAALGVAANWEPWR